MEKAARRFLPSFLHSRLVNSNEKSAVTDDDDDDDDDVEEMQAAELMSDPRMRIHEGGREGGGRGRTGGPLAHGSRSTSSNLDLVEESGAVTKFRESCAIHGGRLVPPDPHIMHVHRRGVRCGRCEGRGVPAYGKS